MAITSVHEIDRMRRVHLDEFGQRKYTRVWRVTTDTKNVGGLEVYFASGIPRLWDTYVTEFEHDFGARVVGISPVQTSDPTTWEITVEYDSGKITPFQARTGGSPVAHGSNPQQKDDTDPLLRPPEISWGFAQHQTYNERDMNGKPYLNSAGMKMDAVPASDDPRLTLTYVRNELGFNKTIARKYINRVNLDPFLGEPAGQVKCQNIGAVAQWERGKFFYRTTYAFHFSNRATGWTIFLLDCGTHERNDAGKLTEITAVLLGIPISGPVPLNGSGKVAAVGTTFFNAFEEYEKVKFAPLQIVVP